MGIKVTVVDGDWSFIRGMCVGMAFITLTLMQWPEITDISSGLWIAAIGYSIGIGMEYCQKKVIPIP
jgi:hypothetical protein